MVESLVPKDLFVGLDRCIWMYTGAEGPACEDTSVVCPEGERLSEQLRSRDVYVWGGDGRLRASVHLFNDSEDVEAVRSTLKEVRV
jgi:selenocysteine lyase/cysteine desulfurase